MWLYKKKNVEAVELGRRFLCCVPGCFGGGSLRDMLERRMARCPIGAKAISLPPYVFCGSRRRDVVATVVKVAFGDREFLTPEGN